MTFSTTALLGALLCGLLALLLAPLVFSIPQRLTLQWVREINEYTDLELSGLQPEASPLSRPQTALLIAAAALLSYAALAIKGLNPEGVALSLYFLGLLLLVAINIKVLLLPDIVVQPMLWAGLLYHAYAGSAPAHIYGAAIGYLAPFLLALLLQKLARNELMGRGDFKAMAMAGAWLGAAGMPLFFAGFVAGFVVWATAVWLARNKARCFVSTGPAHLAGALTAVFTPLLA